MKIALHLGTLRGHGSSAVGRNVLLELVRRGGGHEYVVWVPVEWAMTYGIGPGTLGNHVTVKQTRPGLLQKMATENIEMRIGLRRHRIERLFSLGDTSIPGCPVPHLLLVQQAYLTVDPATLDFPMTAAFNLKMKAMTAYLRAALPTVSKITVQSQTMKQGLMDRYQLEADRVVVIPSAIPDLHVSAPVHPPTRPTLCYVATGSPHKNHELLADVMLGLKASYPDLVCRLTASPKSVPRLYRRAKKLKVLDRFEFSGSVSYDQVLNFIRDATVMVMPSKLESFGLPYYEAMALGRPMVVAERPFAREACQDGAKYADANDPADWVHQIASLLDSDSAQQALSKKALARFAVARMSWSQVAEDYLNLLETL